MPVDTKWIDDEKTILSWCFEGDWTWEEYYAIRDTTNAAIAAIDHPVDLIVDMTNSRTLPKGVMTHARGGVNHTPDNLGVTVFVGVNLLLRSFYKMFSSLYNRLLSEKELEMVMVATLDEAYTLIKAHRRKA